MIDIIFTLLPIIFLIAVIINKIMAKKRSESGISNEQRGKPSDYSSNDDESTQTIFDQINNFKNEAYDNVKSQKNVNRNSNTPIESENTKNFNSSTLQGFKLFLLHLIWYKSNGKKEITTSEIFSVKYFEGMNYQPLYSQLKTLAKLGYLSTNGKIPNIKIKITEKGTEEITSYFTEEELEEKNRQNLMVNSIENILTYNQVDSKTKELYSKLLNDLKNPKK